MIKKVNFTVERIAGFTCQPGRQQSIHWDDKTPGLGIRVTAAGAKSYVFESRLHGRTMRTTIGDVRSWLIPKAQVEARRLKTLIDQNIDPRVQEAERHAKAESDRADARRKAVTVRDAWAAYMKVVKAKSSPRYHLDHIRLSSDGGAEKKRGEGRTVAGPLSSLMDRPLSGLTSEAVAGWLASEAATRPTNAAHAYRLLRAFMRWTADVTEYRGVVSPDAYKSRAISDALPQSQAKAGDVLQREQLPDWFKAVRALPNPTIAAYLQALLITGARREEMAPLKWADVDFKWRSLTIRDKVEGSRTIPLTPYLLTLLVDLKRRNDTPPIVNMRNAVNDWKPSEFVFASSTSASGRVVEPRAAHNKALESAGLPRLTLHGLRRSFGTLSEWVEAPTGVVAQILGHRPSALAEKHYRRRPLDLLRAWHDKIEAWILTEAGVAYAVTQNTPTLAVVA